MVSKLIVTGGVWKLCPLLSDCNCAHYLSHSWRAKMNEWKLETLSEPPQFVQSNCMTWLMRVRNGWYVQQPAQQDIPEQSIQKPKSLLSEILSKLSKLRCSSFSISQQTWEKDAVLWFAPACEQGDKSVVIQSRQAFRNSTLHASHKYYIFICQLWIKNYSLYFSGISRSCTCILSWPSVPSQT